MQVLTPVKAMRAKCLECCCGSFKEVKGCHMVDCPLWAYRLGKRPTPEAVKTVAAAKPGDYLPME